ncbi:hypothetical protein ACMA5I_02345 [Paracoccaceae bacterium GXU_MW_L88]
MTRYETLSQIAKLAADRDIAKLAALSAEKSRLETKLTEIAKQRRDLRALPPSQQSEALKWTVWLEQTEKRVRTQIFEAAKKIEHAKQLAARSYGKFRATEILSEKAAKQARLERNRKAEREGQPPE